MENGEKLTGLIEQAALAANLIDFEDVPGMKSFEAVLDQIKKTVGEMDNVSSEILEQAQTKAADAVEIIEKTLSQEITDADQSAKQLSEMIKDIQDLVTQISKEPAAPAAEEKAEGVSEASAVSTEAAEAKALAAELEASAAEVEASTAETATPAAADTTPPVAAEKPAAAPVAAAPEVSQDSMTISTEDAPLVMDFITEASEHVETSEAGLLALESKPGDNETLNLIFRAFHTIKGMAGFLNLTEIGSLAHAAENLLDLARKNELVLAGKTADIVFESIDVTKKMIVSLRVAMESGSPVARQPNLSDLLSRLKTVAENKGAPSEKETLAEVGKDTKLDTMLTAAPAPAVGAEESAEKAKVAAKDETIKVSTSRLDTLINMVGELVIAQLMIAEDANTLLTSEHSLGRNVAHQSKIVRELQELSMSMRMVPIGGVFQKMTRLVRDLSHKGGKDINLTISGEDTELDRNIVDKIADPLVHMIRNSVDHGIEDPQDRAKTGKNPTGQIKLRAFHQSGNIVIEIEDDGKGLNKERILKKAIDHGIVNPGDQLSDQEIFKLIYHAGLSTAEKITSVSGRGVGMDVVKKNIEALRGRIDIHSELGKGTTFTIRLPLTLAIIDGQVIKVGGERYIIPISSIVQSFRPATGQVSTVQNRGEMVMVRGQLLSLLRLHNLFEITVPEKELTDSLLVVVEEDNRKCCLLVDELLGQQQVVIKSVGDGLGSIKGVSGGAIMGDGKISLILDVPGLMGLIKNQQ